MFRRVVEKAGLKDFGPYDLKGKAATDMYRQRDSLERIQELLGHTSVTTTERYIKARFSESVRPNMTELPPREAVSAGGVGSPRQTNSGWRLSQFLGRKGDTVKFVRYLFPRK